MLTVPRDPIDVPDLPAEYRRARRAAPEVARDAESALAGSVEGLPPLKDALDAYEKEMVRRALDACGGQRASAAAALGITRRWLNQLLRKHDLA